MNDEEREPLGLAFAPAFRVRDPHAHACWEFYSKLQQKGRDFVPTHTRIQRIGHFALNVPKCRETTD